MPKYEIMTILDPKAEMSVLDNLLKTVFGQNSTEKLQKLEITNLAYPIRKAKTAQYFLVNLAAPSKLIGEFVRRANITKVIWRYLIVNLDSEKGLKHKPKIRNRAKKFTIKRDFLEKPAFKINNPKQRLEQNRQKQPYYNKLKNSKFITKDKEQNLNQKTQSAN
ncbi:30S ribosomal protein S6 [Mycoplasma flocculare]|uniref:Small ribosomal subunit protein bS6 n=2 Tax=Mesomycoplasma flocculare TaxID=2128 RepID=A0A0A8E6D0_MESFC|nr:30S ribosomal protein S6 [Mesomycoplasma flocculare]MXR39419.1 30S ribosomal protein S6 [Mycoplasma sp. MF12]AJC49800.1 30S ribosomal protein S6 [Mesomycoplasma flocculare ATCC 27399]ENX51159.1 30S ribosomal protein S6 [Mesomycoplasma flocculare ATCC 27716]MXR12481.1 30S ribosomal protein S6 [Mesomycoplasma flocculare]MXR56891.1 30S ribosomal protein S6 [Mesomycoplasma flocculare]